MKGIILGCEPLLRTLMICVKTTTIILNRKGTVFLTPQAHIVRHNERERVKNVCKGRKHDIMYAL